MQAQKISDQDIVFEDNHLIAVNKLAGILVQGDKTGDTALSESLAIYLKKKYQKPGNVFTGVIHRLDRPVSGLVLFAKTSKGLARMNEIFRERSIQKSYLCIVEGKVLDADGEIKSYLKKDSSMNKSFSTEKQKEGYKEAILKYKVLQHLDNYSLLVIKPLTGRHHQIRVQLSKLGFPIKGDLKYGAKRSNEDGSISLHSYSLEFEHPVKKEPLKIKAPSPTVGIWKHISLD